MTVMETERLVLRPWEETDIPACYELAKDPDVGPMTGWQPHHDLSETEMIVKNVLMVPETYAVVRKEGHVLMGNIALMKRSEAEGEVGCWLGKPYWGHGYIEEACEALLQHAALDLGYQLFSWEYFDGNRQSGRAAEKAGFHETGTYVKHLPVLNQDILMHRCSREITWQDRTAWIENNASFSQQVQGYYGESDGTGYIDLMEQEEKKK
jgi:RimJ/RimL family protein N-acetyltransferase